VPKKPTKQRKGKRQNKPNKQVKKKGKPRRRRGDGAPSEYFDAPVAYGSRGGSSAPSFRSLGSGDIEVTHKVLLETFETVEGEGPQKFRWALNPGLSFFKWVSRMAALYDTFSCTKFQAEYKTGTTTEIAGRIYMYFDTDVKDAQVDDVEGFSQMYGMVDAVLWDRKCILNVPQSMMRRSPTQKLFIRSDQTTIIGDPSLYDCGTLNVLVNPTYLQNPEQTGVPIGELWAHYTFIFRTPNIAPSGVGLLQTGMKTQWEIRNSIEVDNTGGMVAINPYTDTYAPGSQVPVIDQLGLGDMSSLGITIKKDGRYGFKFAQDTGESKEQGSGESDVTVVAHALVNGNLEKWTESNSTQQFDGDDNIAETNSDWVIDLLKDDVVRPLIDFTKLEGKALIKRGSTVAMQFLETLAPAAAASLKVKRKSAVKYSPPQQDGKMETTPSSPSPLNPDREGQIVEYEKELRRLTALVKQLEVGNDMVVVAKPTSAKAL